VAGVFDRKGHLIAASDASVGASGVSARRSQRGQRLAVRFDATGRKWVFATTALLHNEVYVGFAMREASLFAPTYIHVTTDFLTRC
jgi:hypothetical protein